MTQGEKSQILQWVVRDLGVRIAVDAGTIQLRSLSGKVRWQEPLSDLLDIRCWYGLFNPVEVAESHPLVDLADEILISR